ncbi:hypothetical protein PAF17_09955 [Paracoccus sp. Z330]|uniref:VOC family protein n=1 Tax=Paracoccus onchidii TaxID=3017813 RepID=A0ABT4ZEM3_9RHOB|nr:hypothetical protein [Paracoccus onchidii]MDB6177824.1 hypothetical protein [Paracoccus onchidii]
MFIQGAVADAIALWSAAFPDLRILTPATAPDGPTRIRISDLVLDLRPADCQDRHIDDGPITVLIRCSAPGDAARIGAILRPEGQVMLQDDALAGTSRYSWVADRFGVNWQIMSPSEDHRDQDRQSATGPQAT